MNLAQKNIAVLQQLQKNWQLLKKSQVQLEHSYQECQKVGIQETYTIDELAQFEALTARFARTADILTQKIFRGLFLFLQEPIKTFIDGANFLEKIGLTQSDQIIEIRNLRNEISHEYNEDDLLSLFEDICNYTPKLFEIIDKTSAYCSNKGINI